MRDLLPEIESLAEQAHAKASPARTRRVRPVSAAAATPSATPQTPFAPCTVATSRWPRSSRARPAPCWPRRKQALREHPDIRYAGFVHDAEKEYAEARLTLAFIAGHDKLPRPGDLDVDIPAYLNGLGEAVGELRRYLLDRLRLGEVERCEQVPHGHGRGLRHPRHLRLPGRHDRRPRRTTDNTRGILERTRGDLSLAVRQRDLENKLARFEERLGGIG